MAKAEVKRTCGKGKGSLIYAVLETSADGRAPDDEKRSTLASRLAQRLYTEMNRKKVKRANGLSTLAAILQNGQGRDCLWHILMVSVGQDMQENPDGSRELPATTQRYKFRPGRCADDCPEVAMIIVNQGEDYFPVEVKEEDQDLAVEVLKKDNGGADEGVRWLSVAGDETDRLLKSSGLYAIKGASARGIWSRSFFDALTTAAVATDNGAEALFRWKDGVNQAIANASIQYPPPAAEEQDDNYSSAFGWAENVIEVGAGRTDGPRTAAANTVF